jgi:hypothetical protein
LNDQIASHKKFDKRVKRKKLKVNGLNWNKLYVQIKNQGLN